MAMKYFLQKSRKNKNISLILSQIEKSQWKKSALSHAHVITAARCARSDNL
jgi:hypothetical protein